MFDYVEIYDGGDSSANKIGKFCDSTLPSDIQSTGNKLYIKFESDGSGQYFGFSAKFKKGSQYLSKNK